MTEDLLQNEHKRFVSSIQTRNDVEVKKEAILQLQFLWQESNHFQLISLIERNQIDTLDLLMTLTSNLQHEELSEVLLSLLTSLPLSNFPKSSIDSLIESNILTYCSSLLSNCSDAQPVILCCRFLRILVEKLHRIQDLLNNSFAILIKERLPSDLPSESYSNSSDTSATSTILSVVEREMVQVLLSIGREAASYDQVAGLVNQGILSTLFRLVLHPQLDASMKLQIVSIFKQMITIAVRCQQQDQGRLYQQIMNLGMMAVLGQLRHYFDGNEEIITVNILREIQDTLDISHYPSLLQKRR